MKFLYVLLLLFFLAGCSSDEANEMTKQMLKQLKPMPAAEQAEAIKACEQNDGWTGKSVTYNSICIQIRCVPESKK